MENVTVWDVLKSVEQAEGATHGHLLALGATGLEAATAEGVANGWLWLDEHEVYRLTDDGQTALDEHGLS